MGKLVVTPTKPDVIAQKEHELRRVNRKRNIVTKCTVLWSVHDADTNEILAHHSDTAILGSRTFVPDATEEGQVVRTRAVDLNKVLKGMRK